MNWQPFDPFQNCHSCTTKTVIAPQKQLSNVVNMPIYIEHSYIRWIALMYFNESWIAATLESYPSNSKALVHTKIGTSTMVCWSLCELSTHRHTITMCHNSQSSITNLPQSSSSTSSICKTVCKQTDLHSFLVSLTSEIKITPIPSSCADWPQGISQPTVIILPSPDHLYQSCDILHRLKTSSTFTLNPLLSCNHQKPI